MIAMSVADIAAVLGLGTPDNSQQVVTRVEFDSRAVTPGALFVALVGERVDGHDYASAAAAAGAVAVLGSKPLDSDCQLPLLRCRDNDGVISALQQLAHHVAGTLAAQGLTVVGVTGSAGKTSTKDLIAALAATEGETIAPAGSFNNEIGHPYTVLRAGETTRTLVLELSARGIGHIAQLAGIAPPCIGVVLNVGSAHMGEFGSAAAIATAKGELVEALPAATEGGIAILNADDPLVAAMARRTTAAIVTYGTGPDTTIRAVNITMDGQARASFTLHTPEGQALVSLQLVGRHHVHNALAAAAVARAIGVDLATTATVLSQAKPASAWRMAVTELPGNITIINDAYNANPESMRSAIDAAALIAQGRRGWAILGEMGELGQQALAAHQAIGAYAAQAGLRVVAIGPAAAGIYDGAREAATTSGAWYTETIATALGEVTAEIAPGDVILIKASRSVGLEKFATALTDWAHQHHAATTPDAAVKQERT